MKCSIRWKEPVEFFVGGEDLLQSIVDALLQHAGEMPCTCIWNFRNRHLATTTRTRYLSSRAATQELEEGMVFDGHGLPAGCSSDMPQQALYIVTDIYPEHVVLDGNHPLAGIGLDLHLTIHDVRAATSGEMEQGTAGAGFFRIEGQSESRDNVLH